MIPKVSATLRRILRPITFRPKESVTSGKTADSTDYEGFREAPSGPPPSAVELASPVSEPSASTGTPSPALRDHATSTPAVVNPDEIGLTRVILEMRKQTLESGHGEIAAQYETSARDQKTGAKLPKGSMVDRKVG